MEELKPCPFCGGEAEFKPMISNGNHPDDDIGYVRCKSCISETGYNQLRADAIQQWNRRATSENSSELEQLKADNAALKAKYDEINRYNISCTKKIDELLAEKLDTDTHLKAINDSLAEQLRRAAPENKPLTCEGCENAYNGETCGNCSRAIREDLYARKPEGEKNHETT